MPKRPVHVILQSVRFLGVIRIPREQEEFRINHVGAKQNEKSSRKGKQQQLRSRDQLIGAKLQTFIDNGRTTREKILANDAEVVIIKPVAKPRQKK